jgi:hypothetical protein
MNDTYGPLYAVSRAEAATLEMADERAKALAKQFIMDMHTHFLRDDTLHARTGENGDSGEHQRLSIQVSDQAAGRPCH